MKITSYKTKLWIGKLTRIFSPPMRCDPSQNNTPVKRTKIFTRNFQVVCTDTVSIRRWAAFPSETRNISTPPIYLQEKSEYHCCRLLFSFFLLFFFAAKTRRLAKAVDARTETMTQTRSLINVSWHFWMACSRLPPMYSVTVQHCTSQLTLDTVWMYFIFSTHTSICLRQQPDLLTVKHQWFLFLLSDPCPLTTTSNSCYHLDNLHFGVCVN